MVIWDFNSACNNYAAYAFPDEGFQMQNVVWYFMLMKDESFTESIIDRYRELRKTYLSEEYLLSYIDDVVAYLGPAVERNFEVWGYTFEDYRPLNPDSRNPDSYEEAVEQLKEFCRERGEWMDENIEALCQYSHPSGNKKYNH